jgi:hypothetical protein
LLWMRTKRRPVNINNSAAIYNKTAISKNRPQSSQSDSSIYLIQELHMLLVSLKAILVIQRGFKYRSLIHTYAVHVQSHALCLKRAEKLKEHESNTIGAFALLTSLDLNS